MGKIITFNNVTLDGYFEGANSDISWAHRLDPELKAFIEENAKGEATLLFGRKTYELMSSYWPTPLAMENDPVVAERMNRSPKLVVSRSLTTPKWTNTTVIKEDLADEIRTIKRTSEKTITILGSGSVVAQLAQENLIDEYQLMVNPVVLGKGRGLFDGIENTHVLNLIKTRVFGNGNVLLHYTTSG
jgi:dihydrofolate reductase